ncbi:hypothetical protein DV735_g2570, partial [Chaetothyriales sp. CBS 134920]
MASGFLNFVSHQRSGWLSLYSLPDDEIAACQALAAVASAHLLGHYHGDKYAQYQTFMPYLQWEKEEEQNISRRKNRGKRKSAVDEIVQSGMLIHADIADESFDQVEAINHSATKSRILDAAGIEHVLQVHDARCGYLLRRTRQTDGMEEDVAEMGILASMETYPGPGREAGMVSVTAKENIDKTHALAVRIARIRLSHVYRRLIRSVSQVFIEKQRLELVKRKDTGMRLEEIQRYRDEILGADFFQAPSDLRQEECQQFRRKIRDVVARVKIPKGEDKHKDMVEKMPFPFSTFVDIVGIDDESDAAPDVLTELPHYFDVFSAMTGGGKQAAEGCYGARNFQDPSLPIMLDEESSSEIVVPSSESFIPSSDPFDLTYDDNTDYTDSDADDVQPTFKLQYHLTDRGTEEDEEENSLF